LPVLANTTLAARLCGCLLNLTLPKCCIGDEEKAHCSAIFLFYLNDNLVEQQKYAVTPKNPCLPRDMLCRKNKDHTTPFKNMYHRHAKSVNISTNAFFALEKLSPENMKKGPKVSKKNLKR